MRAGRVIRQTRDTTNAYEPEGVYCGEAATADDEWQFTWRTTPRITDLAPVDPGRVTRAACKFFKVSSVRRVHVTDPKR
jgi:hypothetical protein